jgi:hypothetical protein
MDAADPARGENFDPHLMGGIQCPGDGRPTGFSSQDSSCEIPAADFAHVRFASKALQLDVGQTDMDPPVQHGDRGR